MSVAVITGSAGLIGSEAAAFFANLGFDIVGLDNDMRQVFFGAEASTAWNRQRLEQRLGNRYTHHSIDIRDAEAVNNLFNRYSTATALVVHAAAQPSHDWAARPAHGFQRQREWDAQFAGGDEASVQRRHSSSHPRTRCTAIHRTRFHSWSFRRGGKSPRPPI